MYCKSKTTVLVNRVRRLQQPLTLITGDFLTDCILRFLQFRFLPTFLQDFLRQNLFIVCYCTHFVEHLALQKIENILQIISKCFKTEYRHMSHYEKDVSTYSNKNNDHQRCRCKLSCICVSSKIITVEHYNTDLRFQLITKCFSWISSSI